MLVTIQEQHETVLTLKDLRTFEKSVFFMATEKKERAHGVKQARKILNLVEAGVCDEDRHALGWDVSGIFRARSGPPNWAVL